MNISLQSIRRGENTQLVCNNGYQPPPPPGGGVAITNQSNRTSNGFDDTFSNSNNSRRQSSDSGYNSWVRPNANLSNSINNNTQNQRRINPPPDLGVEDVVCNCGAPAVLLTVRKEGPNTGNFLFIYLLMEIFQKDVYRPDRIQPCPFYKIPQLQQGFPLLNNLHSVVLYLGQSGKAILLFLFSLASTYRLCNLPQLYLKCIGDFFELAISSHRPVKMMMMMIVVLHFRS